MATLTKILSLALVLCFAGLAAARAGDDDLITKKSSHDVATTVDRLEKIVEAKGITVMARVDHAKNAQGVGMELRPTQLLIFGNPKLGTLLMQADQQIGLDLPMKVLVWEDSEGAVWLTYVDPADLAERYGIDDDSEVVKKLRKALDAFTTAAAKP
jgi:uncharacterized protein (DUF302 family)